MDGKQLYIKNRIWLYNLYGYIAKAWCELEVKEQDIWNALVDDMNKEGLKCQIR